MLAVTWSSSSWKKGTTSGQHHLRNGPSAVLSTAEGLRAEAVRRGTVRSLSDQTRVAHLKLLEAALPGHLELVEADLLNASSFDSALEGVSCVMHTAYA